MGDKVKYGVIGLGWFGEQHCDTLMGIPHVELTALCTRTEKRLKALGKKFGVKKLYTDYNDMLADPEIEALSVTTMWDQHAKPTLAAIKAGKHVFLEKPMASTMKDCNAIVAAAKKSKKYFMVGHICRFNPRYAKAKEEIAAGKIGKIVSMYARRNIPGWVTEDILNKIGPIIGDGVHDTDLMLWYSGAKVKSVYAQAVDVRKKKYPDLGWTMYRFNTGAIGVLEDVWFLPEKTPFQIDERMEIIGTEGSIHIQEVHPNLSISSKGKGWECPDTTYWPEIRGQVWGALRDELSYFNLCVLEGRKPSVITPDESRAAVEACLAAEKSAKTGKIVKL